MCVRCYVGQRVSATQLGVRLSSQLLGFECMNDVGIACCGSPFESRGRALAVSRHGGTARVPFKQGSNVEETHVNERLGAKPKPNEKAPKKSKKENLGISISLLIPGLLGRVGSHRAGHRPSRVSVADTGLCGTRKGRHFHLSRRFRARRGANGEGRVLFGCVEDDPPTFGMGAERKVTEPV